MPKDVLKYKAYTISEYLDMPDTPQPYLTAGMIYERGKTVLVGKPKKGKSWLAMKLGISVAIGEPLLGLNVTQAPVLLLEFDRRFLVNAIHEIAQGKNTGNMSIIQAPAVPLNEREGLKFLLESVRRFRPEDGSPLLVIIDHKSACFSGKENEDAPNRQWIETLDKVARMYPVSYLVICQAPKGWRGDVVDLPIGSRILTAWADTVISIDKPSRDTRRLEMVSNYGELEPITYTKDFQVIPTEVTEETKRETAMTIIEEHWDEFKYPNISKKVEEITDTLGYSYKTVWDAYREVKRLKKATGGIHEAVDAEAARDEGERENEYS